MLSRSLVVSAQAIMLLLISLVGSTSVSVNSDRVVVVVPATVVDISSATVADRVVFASDRHRTFYFNIYSMKADGSDVRRLTDGLAEDKTPAWSPDAQRIAFTSDRDGRWQMYLMNDDGLNVRRLTSSRGEDRDPAWSPDGQRIAFVSTRDRAWEIYVMYADGSGVARLIHSTKINQSPSRSSDGKYIIYESNSDIAMLRVDESGVANLTNSPAADFQPQFAQLSQ